MIKQLVNVCVTLLVLYNVLQAFKASREDKKLVRRYNKYFMVVSVFLVLDNLFSFVLNLIPFYQLFKMMVMMWMSIPACTGAVFAYRFYMSGMMKRYEGVIDEYLERMKTIVSKYFNAYYEEARKKYKDHRSKDEMKNESLGIRHEEQSRMDDSLMEEGSESGFSTIDSTFNEDKVSDVDTKWSNRSTSDLGSK